MLVLTERPMLGAYPAARGRSGSNASEGFDTVPHDENTMRERGAVLTLVAATQEAGREWYMTAGLIDVAGSALRLLDADWRTLDEQLRASDLVKRVKPGDLDRYTELVADYEARGVRCLTVLDSDYPDNLRRIYNKPPFLFVKGTLVESDRKAVAIVGTRKASNEGLKRASQLARELAARGVTVLSGLASGIDTSAHTGSLEAGGRTIAVIGTGIDRVYPRENVALAERVATSGAVVSQFWPDAPPTRYSFPMRNVVMSGMGVGTVVIEASYTSGAKMQARLALDHQKRLLLVRSLVLQEKWAQKYAERADVTVVNSVDDVLRVLDAEETAGPRGGALDDVKQGQLDLFD